MFSLRLGFYQSSGPQLEIGKHRVAASEDIAKNEYALTTKSLENGFKFPEYFVWRL